jgi:photosystem II stability/assembly factor-like uncharacterized protein
MKKMNLILLLGIFSTLCLQPGFADETWKKMTATGATHLNNVAFAGTGNDTVFVVGRERSVWRSIYKGLSWTRVHHQTDDAKTTNDFLWGVAFFDHLNGFVSGGRTEGSTAEVTLLQTTDGGNTWTDVTASLPQSILDWGGGDGKKQCLYGIRIINQSLAYIHGKSGAVIKMQHDGSQWLYSQVSLGDFGDFRALDFAGTTAFAAADTRKLFKRLSIDNPSEAWTLIDNNWKNTYDVQFYDENLGLSTSLSGEIHKTTNGGATWTPKTSGITNHLMGIAWVDAQTVYTVGYGGKILKSTDAGETWEQITSGQTNNLHNVAHKGGVSIATGLYGTILRFAPEPTAMLSPAKTVELTLYPNPAIDRMTINTAAIVTGITVFDIAGKAVLTPPDPDNTLHVDKLVKGVYFAHVQTNEGTVVKKFIKE